jgi:hypothetical protein
MAMAGNLSHGRPPALSRDDRIAVDRELAAFEGDFAVRSVNLGLILYAPVLVGCAAIALAVRRNRLGVLTGAVIAALLVVFSQSII